jgi:hypothetical protein
MALSDNVCAIRRNSQSHPCDIDGKEGALVFPAQHTLGFQGLSRPAIKAKDAIGF